MAANFMTIPRDLSDNISPKNKRFQTTINKRPRKSLNFDAPIDRFYKKVALLT
jgi:IS30 family transposase